MPSGEKKTCWLSLSGNRCLNQAIRMAAITQIRHQHSGGRAYYEKKIAEGKTHKEALRALKRRISDAIYAALAADARPATAVTGAREGNRGTTLSPGRPALTPSAGSSDKPLPGLAPPYGQQPSPRPRPAHRPPDQRERVTGCPAASPKLPVP